MRLCGFNLGDFVMFVCQGCYLIVKDVTFIIKGAQTFFSEFNSFYLLLLRSKGAAGRYSRLGFYQCAEVIFMVKMLRMQRRETPFAVNFGLPLGRRMLYIFARSPTNSWSAKLEHSSFILPRTLAFVLEQRGWSKASLARDPTCS